MTEQKHDWKPGDVAVNEKGEVVFINGSGALWATPATGRDTHLASHLGDHTLRPLAVIDPKNREQLEQLMRAFTAAEVAVHNGDGLVSCKSGSCWIDVMQTALEEFANPTPPKPDEPTDLAVRAWADKTTWGKVGTWWVSPDLGQVPRDWEWLVERDDFKVIPS